MKNLALILIIALISHCGFTPVYQDKENVNFKITIQNINGDKSINNLLNRKLKRYTVIDVDKNFVINANTSYSKTVLSKDTTGRATDLKLSTNIDFIIKLGEKIQKFSFEESLNIDNSTDFYEQNNYENNIKNNFINTIVEKLIVNLKQIK